MDQVIDAHDRPTIRPPWPLARTLVIIIGLGALLSDALKWPQPRILNVHLLFGVVLLGVVACCLVNAAHSLPQSCGDQFHLYTRRLARQLYGLLYVMAGVRLCLYFIEGAEARNAGHVFSYLARRGSLDDFHVYIAYGLAAACLIRGSTLFTQVPAGQWSHR